MDVNDLLERMVARLTELEARIDELERLEHGAWRGTSATDFTTGVLINPGDYGYQTTDRELQMRVGGTIRAVGMSAL